MCGRELPISQFNTTTFGILHTCRECVTKNQNEGRNKRKEAAKNEMQSSIENAKKQRLSEFSPREMLAELKRRGYKWDKMWIEQIQYVDYTKI